MNKPFSERCKHALIYWQVLWQFAASLINWQINCYERKLSARTYSPFYSSKASILRQQSTKRDLLMYRFWPSVKLENNNQTNHKKEAHDIKHNLGSNFESINISFSKRTCISILETRICLPYDKNLVSLTSWQSWGRGPISCSAQQAPLHHQHHRVAQQACVHLVPHCTRADICKHITNNIHDRRPEDRIMIVDAHLRV